MIELHLYDGGYAGLLLQEDGSVNLCLAISRARLAAAGKPEALIGELLAESPLLADRLGGDLPSAWEAIAGVPYGWRAGGTRPRLFRLGDQAAVIASLAGDGIAVALASGEAAARAFAAGGRDAATAYQREFARRSARPVAVAEALRRGAERPFTRKAMMGCSRLVPGCRRQLPGAAARPEPACRMRLRPRTSAR